LNHPFHILWESLLSPISYKMHFPKPYLLHLLFTSLLSHQTTSATSNPPIAQASAKTIYQLPTTPTWIENLSIRSNNQILLTLTTAPQVHILDPLTGSSKPLPLRPRNRRTPALNLLSHPRKLHLHILRLRHLLCLVSKPNILLFHHQYRSYCIEDCRFP
jgi:hypothetical protein